jgi:beta-glucanase (GH16 family)
MGRESRTSRAGGHRWRMTSMAAVALALTSCATLAGPRAGSGSATPATSATTSQAAGSEAGASQPKAGGRHWALTWHEEFSGTPIRPANWLYLAGGNGWSHRSLMYYTPADASTDGRGHLVLTAKKGGDGHTCWYGPCRYTSARLQTQGIFAQAYGKFEARIQIPLGRGIWPAFWMEGSNGEIDIIETNSKRPNEVHGAAHAPSMNYSASSIWNQPVSASYHIFSVIWTRTGITWTIDGRAYSHMAAYPGWTFNTPFFLILDVAVGGGWPGSPDATTRFPAYLSVDWIRVYRQVR